MEDLERLVRDGFVQPDYGAEFEPVPGGFLMDADFRCEGRIVVSVRKLARIVRTDPDNPEVETAWYSYHAHIRGVGNIVRYDSPFLPDTGGHHRHHHVHRYDILSGDREGTVEEIHDEDRVPHLGDVIREVQAWYYEHVDELRGRGLD